MQSNFTFLEKEYPLLFEACYEAERNYHTSPRITLFSTRRALEIAVKLIYKLEDVALPVDDKIFNLLNSYSFRSLFEDKENKLFDFVRKAGNLAAHSNKEVTSNEALISLQVIHKLTSWMAYCYGSLEVEKEFDINLVPSEAVKIQEMKKLIENEKNEKKKLEKELKKIKSVKQEDKKEKDFKINISEAETRKKYIDLQLKEVGWDINKKDEVELEYKVFGMPNNQSFGFVDYVLWGDDGKPLAVVEAKRMMKSPKEGQQQAVLYADCLEKMTGQRPIIFYTNGFETYIWDDVNYPPRTVFGFYRKDELKTLIERRNNKTSLEEAKKSIDPEIAGRGYQIRAITKVIENYSVKNRKSLIVMATGSGKTRMTISMVNSLIKSNWIKRVLFLADRTALVKQAKNNFKNHLPHISQESLLEVKENSTARLVFSTYQTMISQIDKLNSDGTRQFGVGYFDLIVIDESHRSIYKKYGIIFDYFDSLLLGLTATPLSKDDRNTYRAFDLKNDEPTDSYNLDEAVKQGFLVPPKVIKVSIDFIDNGIHYSKLSKEEKEQYEEAFDDEDGSFIPDHIPASQINKMLFNEDTVKKVLNTLIEKGHKIEDGDKLGKTIIFASNDKHADFIVEMFDKMFPHLKGGFCRKITHKESYAQDLIDKFSDRNKQPQIAVSVDMLDTGIDVPEVLNLVMFKKVYSKSKFWQMIGRGTRLCPDIFGIGQDKQDFLLFDFCKNIEFFEESIENIEPKTQESITQRIFNRRVAFTKHLQNIEFQEQEEYKILWENLVEQLQKDILSIDRNSAFGRKELRYLEKYSIIEVLQNLDDVKQHELKEHLSYLPFEGEKDDISAKKFDLLILAMQISRLEGNKTTKIENNFTKISENLQTKGSIPKVKENIEEIKKIGNREILTTLSILELEEVRIKLRDLMKLLEKQTAGIVFYTDFQDSITNIEESDMDFHKHEYKDYKKALREYLMENEERLSVKKLRNNIPLDESDFNEIETLLSNEKLGGKEKFEENYSETYENLKKSYGDNPLGIFVRSLVGMEEKAVQDAFSEFLISGNFAGSQIDLIEMIVNHYVYEGNFEPAQLVSREFSDLHRDGIRGLFEISEIGKLRQIIDEINERAKGN